MIIDASAIIAVVFSEPDADLYNRAIQDSFDDLLISPINFLEAAVRADQRGPEASEAFDEMIRVSAIQIADVTGQQALLARETYQRYGKGNHRARLNLGDCFAYALAKTRNEPLLYKGNDFSQTDVKAAL